MEYVEIIILHVCISIFCNACDYDECDQITIIKLEYISFDIVFMLASVIS
jgi:hypothetical protein